jgi:hypothetical protein
VWRRWLLAFGAVAFMAAALAAEWWWLPPEGYPQRYGYTGDQYQSVGSLFIQLVITSWHWFRSWFDHDTITTLAIVATAIFTGTLWRATDRLWRISQIHAGHTEQSVTIAQNAANAARSAAAAATEQARIMRNAERPYLIPHEPELMLSQNAFKGSDRVMEVHFDIENLGNGTAFVDSYGIAREICRDGEQGNVALSVRTDFARMPVTGSSIWKADLAFELFSFTEDEKTNVARGRRRLFVYGYLRYSDIFGIFRRTGFIFEGLSRSLEMERSYLVIRSDHNWWYDIEEEPEAHPSGA